MDLAYLFILYVFSKYGISSHNTSNRGSEFVSIFFCLLGTALDMWLHFTLLQITTLKIIDKLNTWTRLLSNIYMYIVIISKTTSMNFCCLWSFLTTMLLVLLLVFFHSSLIRNIIQISPFNISIYSECNIVFSQVYNFTIDLNELQSTIKAEITMA